MFQDFFFRIAVFSTFGLSISIAFGSPIKSSESIAPSAELDIRQSGGFYAIKGVRGSGVQPRLEIRDLEKNSDQWNVYMLGLSRLQNLGQDGKLSYYQISGIHGRPYKPWDGVPQASGGSGGYCAHSSNIFLPWHRPYLALYEEALYDNCRDAIAEFPAGPTRDKYYAALVNFRMPYWDWAMTPPTGEGVVPASMVRATIEVITPNGPSTIPNPLFSYRFHPVIQEDFAGDATRLAWQATMRRPNREDGSAVSRNELASRDLNNAQQGHKDRVHHILTQISKFEDIATDASTDDSMESVHGNVHVIIGGNKGHMTDIPFSAFDPAFWLHHTMIDRLFALWQAVNPDSYVVPKQSRWATFAYPKDALLDANSPLMPFHSDANGGFWTSNTARSTAAFGYTYPELVSNDRGAAIAAINRKYGPPQLVQKRQSPRDFLTPQEETQYYANIKVEKFGLDGSFTVFIFLGDTSTPDVETWSMDRAFVGFDSSFAASSADSNGKRVQTTGLVPLTKALEAKVTSGELQSLDEVHVRAYLRRNLRWKVRKADMTEIPNSMVPDLKVAVLGQRIQPARTVFELPRKIGGYRILADITSGIAGGFGENDSL